MHCELVVPGLLGAGPGATAGTRCAALELLLARGRSRHAPAKPLEQWLREAFDLGEEPFPAGALTLLAAGGDPGADSWARADPIHLRVMRDHAVMVPAEAFELSREEADALCGGLNAHFAGLDFTACEPRRWCARLPAATAGDASFLNEAQMVLHAQPVNEAREARGDPAVNSLSPWGAGPAPRAARCRWLSVAADDPAIRGAARLAGARHRVLPGSARNWLERMPAEGRHLALLDASSASLETLEREWFEPLLAALRAGRVGMVTLQVPGGAQSLSAEIVRGDLRRFWRRRRPVEHYA